MIQPIVVPLSSRRKETVILYNAVTRSSLNKHLPQLEKYKIISEFTGIHWRSIYRSLRVAWAQKYSPSAADIQEYSEKLQSMQTYINEHTEAEQRKKR